MATTEIMLELFIQLALLVTSAFLFSLLKPYLRLRNVLLQQLVQGCLFGLFALVIMLRPIVIVDGIIFDLRNVTIAVVTALVGAVPGSVVCLFVIVFRFSQGGAGAPLAAAAALTSLALGSAIYFYRKRHAGHLDALLIGLGVAIALQSMVWLLLLPAEAARPVIAAIAFPLFLVAPASSWIFGALLRSQQRHLELEAELSAEGNLLRTLIDTVPANVYIKDVHSRFVDANLETIHKLGAKTSGDLLGKTDFDFFAPEFAAKYVADEQAVFQSGQPLLNIEERSMDQRTQQNLWLLTTKAPIRNEHGAITGLVGIGLDITARKQAEQELQAKNEAERRFQTSLKALYEITIELTQIERLDDFYRRVAELALEKLGFERFGLLLYDAEHARVSGTYGTNASGKLVDEHHIQFDPALLTGILKRVLETTERFAIDEHVQLFSNLEPIGFGWNAAAVLWNGEQNLGWLTADNAILHQPVSKPLLDILALYAQTVATLLGRKRAEQALRDNEAKLRTIIDVLPVGVSVLNDDGQIVEINPALARVLDISMDGLLNGDYRLRKYISGDGSPLPADAFPSTRARVEQQTIHDVVIGVVKEDESTVWTSVSAAPMPAANGSVITVTVDITERKQAEAQAFALAAEQQRGKLLREFVTDISHDFRTPLSIISSSTYLLGKTTDANKLTRYSQRIEEQISRLTLLMDSFLELVELEQRASTLQYRAVDLDALLTMIIDHNQPEAQAKRQRLEYRRETDSALVLGDSAALTKAIHNLVDNAIHYTPDEGSITLRLYRDGDNLVVAVVDTGIGIPVADLSRIFESFYRVDSARSAESGGAGLGLPIAKKLIELMKGHIEVESEFGTGSVFQIYLPVMHKYPA